jgi:hypothetical protein
VTHCHLALLALAHGRPLHPVNHEGHPLPMWHPTETISLILPIQTDQHLITRRTTLQVAREEPSVVRSTQLLSSAACVPSDSPAHTICEVISEHIPMRGLLCVAIVARRLHANTIGRDTRVCIAERRSLSAEVNSKTETTGDAEDDSQEQTPSADISEAKPEDCASSR